MYTFQFEQERGHAASGVECYMKQYGLSECRESAKDNGNQGG